jgi:phosphoribosyl-ATP pyrophosphohydrolase
MGIVFDQPLNPERSPALSKLGQDLVAMSNRLEDEVSSGDRRFLRAHLLIEELGEAILAMANGDEATLLDGLSDLLYVLFGTAITFDLPIEEGFCEAHRTNMTKCPQPDDPLRERVRDKGPNFAAPDFQAVIDAYRAQPRRRTPSNDLIADLDRRYTTAMRPVMAYQEMAEDSRLLIDQTCKAMMWNPTFHGQVCKALTTIVADYHQSVIDTEELRDNDEQV